MAKSEKPKGFTPSPFFTSWWGSLAERVWRCAPLKRKLSSRSKIPHKTQKDKSPHDKCPCEAFTMCDTYYQNMDPFLKDLWRRSPKKPGMSGYGLFMKECLCLLIAGYNFPEGPSPSGGYNCITVEPGDEEPPLEGFIGQAKVRYRCIGAPSWECVPSPSGAYTNLEECQAVCHPPYKWLCTGDPLWNCILDPEGTYETEAACLTACIPPLNTCNACDPPIPDTLYMTNTNLTGDFAIFNDKRPIFWRNECLWRDGITDPSKRLTWSEGARAWEAMILVRSGCHKTWSTARFPPEPGPLCAPTTPLLPFGCFDTQCTDQQSCEESAAATCTITLT